MRFLVFAVLLLGIEVTLQFRNIPRDHGPSTNDHDVDDEDDYLRCTVRTIEKLREPTTTNLIFYTGDDSANEASTIVRSLFDMKRPMTLLISKPHQLDRRRIVNEKMCISVVNNETLLREILKMLYHDIHHRMCVICVTFHVYDGIEEIGRITENIWTTGVPRNVIFIVSNFDREGVRIIGVPAYSRGNCLRTKLIEVGQYRNGKFHVYVDGLYPRLNDLGGCELSVMVQPPMLPYVERMENSPGGMIGDLMEIMGKSMNFAPSYVWSVSHEDMINHLYSRDLNVMVDMTPRATVPITDYRFSVGVVTVSFIVPRTERKIWNNLFAPFHRSIWVVIVIILAAIAALSTLSKGTDRSNVVLQIFGTLLGVGVGGIISEHGWMRIFLWFWLLPAYVLVQSYLACLTKEITVPIFVPEIQTLTDLVNSRLDVMCGVSTRNGLCRINEEPFQMLCAKCRITNDKEIWSDFYPNLTRTGSMNGKSVIANSEFIQGHPAFLNVHAIDDGTIEVNQLVEVRPGSSWIFEMEKIWERIIASGLVHFWRSRYVDAKRRKAAVNSIRTFHPEFVWSGVVMLIIGWIISFGCFVGEFIFSRLRQ